MLTVYGCIQYCMGYLEIVYYICILYVVYCILYFGKSYIVNRILYLVVCFFVDACGILCMAVYGVYYT